MNNNNLSVNKIVIVLILISVTAGSFFLSHMSEKMVDFGVNYQAGKRLRWGETLYRVEDEHYMFKYLPFAAVIYLPLSYLDPAAAKGIWYFIIAASIIGILYLSKKLLPRTEVKPWLLFSLTFLILGRFFLREIYLGQINAVVTLFMLLMLSLLKSGQESRPKCRQVWSGVFWGFAVLLKPYAVIFLPYFLFKKKWIVLASGAALLLIGFFVPVLYYGFEGNLIVFKEWVNTLSRSTPGLFSSQDNVSLIAFFVKWTGDRSLSLVLAAGIIGILAGAVLVLILNGKKNNQPIVLEGFLLLMLIPLISPLGWDYTFLLAAPGVMLLLNKYNLLQKKGKILLALNFMVITFLIYDLLGEKLYALFMSWSIITINFIILAGFLFYLRFKKMA